MERLVTLFRWWTTRRQMRRFLAGNPDADRLRPLFEQTLAGIWKGNR